MNASFQINPSQFSSEQLLKLPAMCALVGHLMKEPCYDQLRTKEQLGYMVWSGASRTCGIYSIWFIVQSPEKGPDFLDNRCENFIENFYTILKEMTAETFQSNIQACVLTRTKKDVSLYSQAGRYWKEIEDNAYVFNRKFKTAETLKTVTKEDVMSLFENHIKSDGKYRSKISSHIVGKDKSEVDDVLFAAQVEQGTVLVGDNTSAMDDFKRGCALYPTVKRK